MSDKSPFAHFSFFTACGGPSAPPCPSLKKGIPNLETQLPPPPQIGAVTHNQVGPPPNLDPNLNPSFPSVTWAHNPVNSLHEIKADNEYQQARTDQ
eukprot:1161894-Pelagomonas_calceolata.AAC.8